VHKPLPDFTCETGLVLFPPELVPGVGHPLVDKLGNHAVRRLMMRKLESYNAFTEKLEYKAVIAASIKIAQDPRAAGKQATTLLGHANFGNRRQAQELEQSRRPRQCRSSMPKFKFAGDSPLEGTGFEPSVPLLRKVSRLLPKGDAGPISWMAH
jgi:hypothetical protein